jgi:hypothetical protein
MTKRKQLLLLPMLLGLLDTETLAAPRVDNFALLDQSGKHHELYYYRDAKAIVLMIQGNGCPIVRNAWPTLQDIRADYEDKGIRFLMLNANPQDHRASISEEATSFGIDLPILDDSTQLVAENLGVIRTGEVFVIDPVSWELLYRGPIDDRLSYERQKSVASEYYLVDTLDAVVAGENVSFEKRGGVGCLVNMLEKGKDAQHAAISYSDTIAPMLQENCQGCHRKGGIGPWAMTDYNMIRGFAPMIREVVRTNRMPPWHADPMVGEFHEARGLSDGDKQTLVHWIEAGAPRGEGPDLLAENYQPAPEWELGEPDVVLDLAATSVPATGVVEYVYLAAHNPLDRDVWIKAVALNPGDPTVVHHTLISSVDHRVEVPENKHIDDNLVATYVPNAAPTMYPDGTGMMIPQGGSFVVQMHYTTTGRATVDASQIGLYLYDERPEHVMRNQAIFNLAIEIPPGAKNHGDRSYYEFEREATLYSLFPHAHFRGKSSQFTLRYPDGEEEPLLSVPKFDFNWQHTYTLKQPKTVPAGTKLILSKQFDNSAENLANPDPSKTVLWGEQSFEEMLWGTVTYTWKGETSAAQTHSRERSELRQLWGFYDADMDGFMSLTEFQASHSYEAETGDADYVAGDTDRDGRLSFDEFYSL